MSCYASIPIDWHLYMRTLLRGVWEGSVLEIMTDAFNGYRTDIVGRMPQIETSIIRRLMSTWKFGCDHPLACILLHHFKRKSDFGSWRKHLARRNIGSLHQVKARFY